MNITCTNDAPVATNDTYIVTGSLATLNTLANDTDIDSAYETQTFSISSYTQPAHGTLSINGNNFDYSPDVGYAGGDSFTYSMQDQSGALSNTGTVNITVDTPPTDS